MNIEEILRHENVHCLDVRHTPEDEFTIYPHIYDSAGFPFEHSPSLGNTLQEALDKIVKRFKLEG